MKRDRALLRLSREHHGALSLAQRLIRLGGAIGDDAARGFAEQFAAELAPHFAAEEATLLPALAAVGKTALDQRTRREHAELRVLAQTVAARAGQHAALALAFARLLKAHVHFEERELFPAAEAALPADALRTLRHQLDSDSFPAPETCHVPNPAPASVA